MVHLTRHHITSQNFSQIYSCYVQRHMKDSIANNKTQKFDEQQAFKAFEKIMEKQHLVVWQQTTPTNGVDHDPAYTGTSVQRRFLPVRLLLSEREFQSALKQRIVEAPTWLVLWSSGRNV
jgi:hypothetical protein